MEDNKKVYKFFGKPGEDFFLWSARTEAALAAKEVLAMIDEDYLSRGEAPSVELQKKIATARAILIQGLGDRPLRLCLCVKDNPFEIWRRLKDRYAVSNTATKVQLQTRLARMSYEGQSMQDYIDSFEQIFNRLAAIKSEVAEDLQVAMLLASFGDKSKSRFGYSIAALQTSQDNLDWETVTSTLLQENDDHLLRSASVGGTAKIDEHTRALSENASHQYGGSRRRTWKGKTKARPDRRRCYACGKIGHIARDCSSKDGNTRKNSFIGSNEEAAHANVWQIQPARLLMAHVQRSNHVLGLMTKPCRSDDQCGSTDVGIQSSTLLQSVSAEHQRSCILNAMKSSSRRRGHHDVFLLDSGASEHMIWSKKHLGNLKSIKAQDIFLGDGNRVTARHAGTFFLRTLVRISGKQFERSIVLQNVLYVPDLHSNLISCSRLCEVGFRINIERDRCQGSHNDTIQFQGRKAEGVYQIIARCLDPRLLHASTATSKQREEPRFSSSSAVDIHTYSESFWKLWHERLGHAHFGSIKQLKSRCAVTGMDTKGAFDSREQCDSCMKGKQTKRSLGIKKTRSVERCAVIHTDICGPMSVDSFSGCRYFVSFVDEYTGYIVIVPITRKSDTLKQFKLFQAWIERKFGGVVKQVRSDHGGEYIAMKDYLSSAGIEHCMSPPYCPNLNGMAERANRTIVECARTMLEHASLPRKFWAEAVVHAARIRNLLFCPRDRTTSSHELISDLKPEVSYLRTFGSLAWYHIPKEARKKLDAKSEKGILVGCQENKQYKIWLVDRSVAVVSRDVTICETRFPGCDLNEERDEPEYELVEDSDTQQSANFPTTREDRYSKSNGAPVQRENSESHQNDKEVQITSTQQQRLTYYPPYEEESNTEPHEEADRSTADHSRGQRITENTERREESRYPRREHRRPSYYTPGFGNVARALAMLERNPNPTTVKEALTQDDAAEWQIAIDSELNSLRQHGTWDIVDHPLGMKPLSTRFVFIRKFDENGIVIRHKARLVVRGYLQGDVEQTFAPVVDFTTVRTCLAVAVQRNYSIQQLDVTTAFLHGEIDSQVFVNPPSGVDICESGKTLKLRRGLYGLKQAPRLWQDKWKSVMTKMEFKVLSSDECVYRRGLIWLLLYVDDIIVMGANHDGVCRVKDELKLYLDVKDLGKLKSFLGVAFIHARHGAWLSQRHYVNQVLERFGMSSCKTVSTPMSEGALKDISEPNTASANQAEYQELLGCLLFISTRTRPDISAAVSILCRYASNPNQTQWVSLKRILRYLRGTKDYSLFIHGSSDLVLSSYCDADWAGDRQDRRSTTGVLVQIGESVVAWRTTKQGCVALSSTEAEFIALSESAKLVFWIRRILGELECRQEATTIHEDNQGALVWGSEGIRNAKHIAIRRNFVKEQVKHGNISLKYCPTQNMVADVPTKPLGRVRFEFHRERLGIRNISAALTRQEGVLN